MFVIAIVAPFGLALILNTVISTADDLTAEYAIVDEDRGELSQRFAEVLESIDVLDVELTTGLSEEDAVEQIDQERLDAAFVFPSGFSETVTSPEGGPGAAGTEREARITVVGNVDSPIATQVASAIADEFAYRVNATQLSVATVAAGERGLEPEQLDALVQEASSQASPVAVGELDADDRELDDATQLIAGMSVMFLFFTVLFGVMGMFEERDQGTLPRLQAAPIRRGAIVLAKALGSVVLGLSAMAVLVTGSSVLMGADWGDPLAVAALSVAVVLAAVSIMGLVAAAAKKTEQAFAVQGMIAMVLAIVGGSFFPVNRGQGWLTTVSAVTPHFWFIRGLGDSQVGGIGDVLTPLAALGGFAVVFGTAGALVLRRRAEA